MKRYLLFAGERYYPSGGWFDFRESFDTASQAVESVDGSETCDWYHVVDSATGVVVRYYPMSEQELATNASQ